MSGTKSGGKLAYERNIANDPDHYSKIGSMGGKKSKRHLTNEEAVAMGSKGGKRRWEKHPYYLKQGETVASRAKG
jgi:general stress protein YciG